jgi:hypothetical protein
MAAQSEFLYIPISEIEVMFLKHGNHWILPPKRQVTSGFLLVINTII